MTTPMIIMIPANVLTHAEFRVRVEQYLLFQRVCSVVVGDAGTLR